MLLSRPQDPRWNVCRCRHRRRLPQINAHGKFLDDAIASTFYNREDELTILNKTLAPTVKGCPGKLLLLLGPKDSGKTALIGEFRRRQKRGTCRGVSSYVDLRQGWEPQEFAANLSTAFLDSFSGKFSVGGFSLQKSADGVSFKADPGDVDLEFSGQSGIRGVLTEVEKYGFCWKNVFRLVNRDYDYGFPTVFIDEANLLSNWTKTKAGVQNLEALLAGLVRISKQECSANVVLASSDNFFREWLRTRPALKGSSLSFGTVGHFSKQEAMGFLETMLQPCAKLQLHEIWGDIFGYVGGSIMVLWEVVQLFNTAADDGRPISEVWNEWKEDKLTASISFLREETVKSRDPTRSPPEWTQDEWKKAVELMAQAPDGVVPYARLIKEINKASVNSLIEHDLLNYRVWTGWDKKDVTAERKSWPIIMPYNKQHHVAMREIVAEGW